ncbi:MAG: FxsA family protein [Micavibrio sp.]|nr:FxsA family protein [Micavibrio sp.]
MFAFLSPLAYLPLAEIAGFIIIGGRIGLGYTLLWLIFSTMLGFSLLKTSAAGAFSNVRTGKDADFFAEQGVFDSLCLMVAAFLLIFPGFISDFIAIPFIIGPFRHWLFLRSKNNPDSFLRKFTTTGSRNFRAGGNAPQPPGAGTTIDAEFQRIDDTEQLPKQ